MHILVLVCTILGALTVVGGVAGANGSPQEAAAAAIGLALGVLPYIFYKVRYCEKALENQRKIIAALEKQI
jgi:hypothetical protein